jgi:hypothetical protein
MTVSEQLFHFLGGPDVCPELALKSFGFFPPRTRRTFRMSGQCPAETDLSGHRTCPDGHGCPARISHNQMASGLVWSLQGSSMVALTEATAAIQNPTGNVTVYRKNNKPALGPVGDSLDEFK